MKRVLILIAFITLFNSAVCAQGILPFKKKTVETKQETLTSQQARILYAENSIDKAFDMIISIPEEERSAHDYLLLGNILQDRGKNGEAIFMYNKALCEDKTFQKAYYNLGVIYLQEDKPNMAAEEFKKLIKLNPENPYAHYNLGCAYMQTGKFGSAKNSFLRAIQIRNTVPDFHYNLAYVYKKLNNEKAAKRYLEFYNKLTEND